MASVSGVKPKLSMSACLAMPVEWKLMNDVDLPYRANDPGLDWVLKLNDFPAEPMFSLLVEGVVVGSFDDWPASWIRPVRSADPRQ